MAHLVVESLHKTYAGPDGGVQALRGVSFVAERGEFLALWGPSGCGKSTLLHLVGGMDRPTDGAVYLNGQPLHNLGRSQLAVVRRRRVGFVFQSFYLLPTLTVSENVALPLTLDGVRGTVAQARAEEVLVQVGLVHKARMQPSQLSGGEMQRVAIARAIVARPEILLADEPTGSLDSENGTRILELLRTLNSEHQLTVLLATHAPEAAACAQRTLRLLDGRLESVVDRDGRVSASV